MKLESNTTNKVKLNCIITYIQMKRLKLNDRATSGINRRGATAHPCLRRLVLFDSWTKTASKANIHQHSLHTLAQRVGPTCSANVWRSLSRPLTICHLLTLGRGPHNRMLPSRARWIQVFLRGWNSSRSFSSSFIRWSLRPAVLNNNSVSLGM